MAGAGGPELEILFQNRRRRVRDLRDHSAPQVKCCILQSTVMRCVLALAIVLSLLPPIASANDAAASTATGGIQLRQEARISMEKELLSISEKKISVEYEFLNETDRDITTEVAFPVPPYDLNWTEAQRSRRIDDFRVWVEGRSLSYRTEAKAMLRGVDNSALLTKMGVDIASFAHFFEDNDGRRGSRDIQRLPRSQQRELIRLGLIDTEDKLPTWTVFKTYHWQETFPARKLLHVLHEYAPVIGFEQLTAVDLQGKGTPRFANVSNACVDLPLQKKLVSEIPKEDGVIPTFWIDYVLTTANTWKKPIKQFELVVERPQPDGSWRVG